MSTLNLARRMPAIQIFFLTLSLLTGTVVASENTFGSIPFLVYDKDKTLVVQYEGLVSPEQLRLNWEDMSSLKYEKQEHASSAGTPRSLAEVYLTRLTEEHNEAWEKKGWAGLLGGALLTAVGVYMMASDEGSGYASVAGAGLAGSGVLMGGVGVYYLNCPGRVEREIDRLLNITDPVRKERVGHETLVSLAHSARVARIALAVSVAAFGASGYVVFRNEYGGFPLQAVMMYGYVGFMTYLALVTLTSESVEEMALEEYLEESKQREKIKLRLGIDPSGRGRIGLVFSF